MEAKTIIWTRRASIQLESAQDYIANDDPHAADAFLDRILEMVDELLRFPEIGRVIPEYENPNFRERIIGRYRLMYTVEEQIIRILALYHEAQETPKHL